MVGYEGSEGGLAGVSLSLRNVMEVPSAPARPENDIGRRSDTMYVSPSPYVVCSSQIEPNPNRSPGQDSRGTELCQTANMSPYANVIKKEDTTSRTRRGATFRTQSQYQANRRGPTPWGGASNMGRGQKTNSVIHHLPGEKK